VINRPCQMGQSQLSPGGGGGAGHLASSHGVQERPRSVIIEEDDVMPALNGLIELFKVCFERVQSGISSCDWCCCVILLLGSLSVD